MSRWNIATIIQCEGICRCHTELSSDAGSRRDQHGTWNDSRWRNRMQYIKPMVRQNHANYSMQRRCLGIMLRAFVIRRYRGCSAARKDSKQNRRNSQLGRKWNNTASFATTGENRVDSKTRNSKENRRSETRREQVKRLKFALKMQYSMSFSFQEDWRPWLLCIPFPILR